MTTPAPLADQLARQAEAQRRLLSLARAQADALRRGDLNALRLITAEQESVLLDSGRLQRERADEAERLCASVGLAADASVDELAAALPPEQAADLMRESRTLGEAIAELRDANELNRELIEQELTLIDHLVRHVILGQPDGYGERDVPAPTRQLLDLRG